MTQKVQKAVVEQLGPDAVTSDPETCSAYGRHTLPDADHIPDAVLYPHSTHDVQTIVQLANSHRVPLFPIGISKLKRQLDRLSVSTIGVSTHSQR